jgi:hypothetical protein
MIINKNSLLIAGIASLLILLAACSQPNPLDELETWDMVYISDSTGFGVPDKFAANIERDTGKQVVVHNWLQGGLPVLEVLEDLHAEPWIRNLSEDIAEAELIIFFANPRGDPEKGGLNQGGIETCMNARSCRLPEDCSSEYYAPYIENIEKFYQEIFALREGQATIIYALDLYNPLISEHQECGTEDGCTQCWETFNAAVHQAAKEYGIPVVSVYDLFNGPDHDQDPRAKGYIISDGEHTSESGQQAIADLLSQAGYTPLIP